MYCKEDLELKLLRGKPIDIGIGTIYPLTLDEINQIGYSKYNFYITLLLIDKDSLKKADVDISDFSSFDIIYQICLVDKQFKENYFNMLEIFFKETIQIGNGFFYFGNLNEKRIIFRDNFNQIIEILKQINNITTKDEELNPADARAKEILEKRKKAREIVAKVKNAEDNNEPLTLADLVSILCANGNNINLLNVWDLTFYQFNNQFNRMKMLEDYDINIRSLMAGADPSKIELKHWMSKIK